MATYENEDVDELRNRSLFELSEAGASSLLADNLKFHIDGISSKNELIRKESAYELLLICSVKNNIVAFKTNGYIKTLLRLFASVDPDIDDTVSFCLNAIAIILLLEKNSKDFLNIDLKPIYLRNLVTVSFAKNNSTSSIAPENSFCLKKRETHDVYEPRSSNVHVEKGERGFLKKRKLSRKYDSSNSKLCEMKSFESSLMQSYNTDMNSLELFDDCNGRETTSVRNGTKCTQDHSSPNIYEIIDEVCYHKYTNNAEIKTRDILAKAKDVVKKTLPDFYRLLWEEGVSFRNHIGLILANRMVVESVHTFHLSNNKPSSAFGDRMQRALSKQYLDIFAAPSATEPADFTTQRKDCDLRRLLQAPPTPEIHSEHGYASPSRRQRSNSSSRSPSTSRHSHSPSTRSPNTSKNTRSPVTVCQASVTFTFASPLELLCREVYAALGRVLHTLTRSNRSPSRGTSPPSSPSSLHNGYLEGHDSWRLWLCLGILDAVCYRNSSTQEFVRCYSCDTVGGVSSQGNAKTLLDLLSELLSHLTPYALVDIRETSPVPPVSGQDVSSSMIENEPVIPAHSQTTALEVSLSGRLDSEAKSKDDSFLKISDVFPELRRGGSGARGEGFQLCWIDLWESSLRLLVELLLPSASANNIQSRVCKNPIVTPVSSVSVVRMVFPVLDVLCECMSLRRALELRGCGRGIGVGSLSRGDVGQDRLAFDCILQSISALSVVLKYLTQSSSSPPSPITSQLEQLPSLLHSLILAESKSFISDLVSGAEGELRKGLGSYQPVCASVSLCSSVQASSPEKMDKKCDANDNRKIGDGGCVNNEAIPVPEIVLAAHASLLLHQLANSGMLIPSWDYEEEDSKNPSFPCDDCTKISAIDKDSMWPLDMPKRPLYIDSKVVRDENPTRCGSPWWLPLRILVAFVALQAKSGLLLVDNLHEVLQTVGELQGTSLPQLRNIDSTSNCESPGSTPLRKEKDLVPESTNSLFHRKTVCPSPSGKSPLMAQRSCSVFDFDE